MDALYSIALISDTHRTRATHTNTNGQMCVCVCVCGAHCSSSGSGSRCFPFLLSIDKRAPPSASISTRQFRWYCRRRRRRNERKKTTERIPFYLTWTPFALMCFFLLYNCNSSPTIWFISSCCCRRPCRSRRLLVISFFWRRRQRRRLVAALLLFSSESRHLPGDARARRVLLRYLSERKRVAQSRCVHSTLFYIFFCRPLLS